MTPLPVLLFCSVIVPAVNVKSPFTSSVPVIADPPVARFSVAVVFITKFPLTRIVALAREATLLFAVDAKLKFCPISYSAVVPDTDQKTGICVLATFNEPSMVIVGLATVANVNGLLLQLVIVRSPLMSLS